MKAIFPLAILMALSLSVVTAQNAAPKVIITNVSVDEPAQAVYVTYDLLDDEYDPCEVWFGISLDGGQTFLAENGTVFGDVGPGIGAGPGRQISWFAQSLPDLYQAIVRVVADDGHPVDIQALVDQVDEAGVYERLTQLAVKRHHTGNPSGLEQVRDTLTALFEQYGLQVEQQPAFFQTYSYPNILARQGGWVHEDTTYIVDAHYDGVTQGPGADDNATGVVGTIEVARILSQVPCRKSIRYIGFAFEEQGLVGSNEYVNKGGIKSWEKIAGVLNMEMIGYFSNKINSQTVPAGFDLLFPAATADIAAQLYRGNFLIVAGNTASQPLITAFETAADTYVPELRTVSLAVPGNGQIAPDLRRSDHSRFWDAGYQALMLTDGAETRNKNYHTAKDVVDSLDLNFLSNNIRAVLATTVTLAEPMHAGQDVFVLSDLVSTDDHNHASACRISCSVNPIRDLLMLSINDCAGESMVATLYALDGRALLSRQIQPVADREEVQIPIGRPAAGTYLLVIESSHHSTTLTVVVE